ncbi:hypothetical protein DUNSADRAFT_13258 [Dunaliella salina]|uniref:Encoded protein n=1 Tax=Dunaliella salina TaxID=3046 RepID=A0ABQ7G9S3_DUNSA|nr:hypothetical protein DUNSADRAFT_13258 [Dunaliella salina]|eukprot:KAF5831351.1 hypothetical protein DUNSADRAFT_13258 [Dunaliella salina]
MQAHTMLIPCSCKLIPSSHHASPYVDPTDYISIHIRQPKPGWWRQETLLFGQHQRLTGHIKKGSGMQA